MKKIEVTVGKKGELKTDFTGFLGDACLDEADKLRKLLMGLGLEIDPGEVLMKPRARQEAEAGIEEDEKKKSDVKVE